MIVGSAEILVKPNMALFEREIRAASAPAFSGVGKDAEKAGEHAGSRMGKGFGKTLESGVATALGAVGVPLGTFGQRLTHTAGAFGEVDRRGHGAVETLSRLGGIVTAGAAAGLVAVGAAGVDAALKTEKVTSAIAASAGISIPAAKKISEVFTSSMGETVYAGREIGQAYSGVAGVFGTVAGHALDATEATKVMDAAMNLAEAGIGELNTTTAALARTMLAYHVGATGAAHTSDVLFNVARATGTQIEQLATQFTRMKGRLGELMPDLGESAALMLTFAEHGITGRQSLMALNGSFNTLLGGGKKVEAMAKALGIHVFDASGKFVGMKSVIEQLQPRLAGLSQEQQLQATKALFGASANKALLGVVLAGPAAYQKNIEKVEQSGTAAVAARKQHENLKGEWEKLRAKAIDLAEKIGAFLIPKLMALAKVTAEVIEWFNKHQAAAIALAGVITTVLGTAVAVFVYTKAIVFGTAIKGMVASMASLVSSVMGGTAKIVGSFTEQTVASQTAAEKIAASNSQIDVSFSGVAAASTSTATKVGASETAMVGEVTTADTAIEAENATAGRSFMALLGPIGAVVAALTAAQPLINKVTGGGLGENESREKSFLESFNKRGQQRVLDTGGGIMAFFEAKGLSPAAAAGIVGNVQQESSFDPNAAGGGLFQDIGSRAASGRGNTTHQLEAAWRELQGMPSTLAALKRARTPQEAAKIFSEQFERPGEPMLGNRERYAAEALKDHPHATAKEISQHSGAIHVDTKAIEEHIKALSESTKAHHTHASHMKKTSEHRLFTPHGGSVGFFEAPGTNYMYGKEEELAARLDALGKAEHMRLTGVSGYRTPAHSLAVGGFANDPHTRGLASDTEGAQGISEAILRKFGLTRPFAGAKEADHIQLLPGVAALKQGGHEVGVGGLELKKVSAAIEMIAKIELKKQTEDHKTGVSLMSKMVAAIHSGGVKELTKVVGNVHDVTMKQLKNDHHSALGKLIDRLHADHTNALDKLAKELVATHKKALDALKEALVKVAEKAKVEQLGKEDQINQDTAEGRAQQIADATKVQLDQAAEQGKAGAELIVAQAQTKLDAVKQANDAAINAAKIAGDKASGTGELTEAIAKQNLVNAEDAAKISDAQAQRELDLANNASQEAQTAAQRAKTTAEEKQAAEEKTKTVKEEAATAKTGAATQQQRMEWHFNFYGANPTMADIISEVGWTLKTGTLPQAQATIPASTTVVA